MKKLLTLLLLLYGISAQAQKYNYVRPNLSLKDSLRLKGYLDSAGHVGLFSPRRQLYLDSALSIIPDYAYWWQQKAMPLFKQKKYELGLPYLDSAVKYDDGEHWLEYRAFLKCIFQKSYRSSIEDFELAKKLYGDNGVMDHYYDFYMGLCYLQLNEFDKAEQLMKRCVERDKQAHSDDWVHYMHWFYLGVIYYEKEDLPKAMDCFDNTLKLYKNFSDVKYYQGMCYEKMNDLKQALICMNEADKDLKDGYTINEDNSFYETYPYQLNKAYLDAELRWLREKNNSMK